jgi:hypothetical protein
MTDDEIEAMAKKHICPHHDRLEAILPNRVPYQQTEQFRRVKALVDDVLSKLRAPKPLGDRCHHCGWTDWVSQDGAAYCQACGKPHGSVPKEGLPNLPQLLRENADLDAAEGGNPDVVALEWAAADEIERLRREVSKLRAPVADERAAFERFQRRTGLDELYLERHATHGQYMWTATKEAWETWQARAALASAPAPFDRRQLRALVDLVWNEATESTAVPDTPWADRMIDKVFSSLPASAAVAGEAQPSDIDILGLAGQYIQPSPVDVALQIVNFSRALLSRYATPQASEAALDADRQPASAPLLKAARRAVLALAAAAERDPAFQGDYDALSAALSAQPGAQKNGGSDA